MVTERCKSVSDDSDLTANPDENPRRKEHADAEMQQMVDSSINQTDNQDSQLPPKLDY